MSIKKKNILKTTGVVVILVVGFLSMNFLGSTQKQSNKRETKPEIRTVEVQNLNFGEIALEVKGNGVINPQQSLSLISEVNGKVTFAKNNLKSGTSVEKGEIILQFDSREAENQLYSLRSDFLNTVATILPDLKIENQIIYDKWYNYFQSIDIEKDIPELPQLSNSQEKIKVSTRNILTKYYNVKNQEILLSKHTINAPFRGFIKSNGIIENSFVSRGQHICDLEDVVNLEIAVPLLVKDFKMIDFNRFPQVQILTNEDEGSSIKGRIVRTDQNLSRNSQTLNVYVSFTNPNLNTSFLPGKYADVLIEGKTIQNAASVPRHIVEDNKFVYTMEKGKLARRTIELLAIQENQAIIKNTFPENTQVVTTILQKPIIGMEIKILGETYKDQEISGTEVTDKEKEI